jgi:tRNA threonylcarbamoyl adenosine modification protein (Sua5/YciO/YrdC/YwlC family)
VESRPRVFPGAFSNRKAQTLAAELLKVSAEAPEIAALRYACDFIERGQVVGIPTDTYYGLAADPFNLAAVEQIYQIKGRPENRALPILVNSIEQATGLARDLPEIFPKLARKFWPGALTLLVDASHQLPLKVTANTGRVALRWPNAKIVTWLIEMLEGPVTGTSANISGFPPCSHCDQLVKQLGDRLPLILDSGETGATLASTIVDVQSNGWRIIREGIISEADIRAALES